MMQTHHSAAAVTLAALGVVYGDIGTSPLYTLKETFTSSTLPVNEANVFGFVSLIFWALLLIVTLKYVLFVLRADNKGEGGVVVMMQQAVSVLNGKAAWLIMMAGLCGTALFFGDAVITPAISVLSAAEGLTVLNPALEAWILPMTCTVLVVLFVVQRKGTQHIGALFGPVMLVWFSVLAAVGVYQIVQQPHILAALNPWYGIHFALHHGWQGFVSLGAVVLAVTGAEALYADMGHFGRKSIQTAWMGLVLPALVLNYAGQGALLLSHPEAVSSPFFNSFPSWALLPVIVLATAATVIASQAVISGAFSLTRQAVQLGFVPRMKILHTNAGEIGQIYVPVVNWLLLAVVLLLVFGFQNSSNLAAAYGIAATGTMVLTTVMLVVVMRRRWQRSWLFCGVLTTVFLTFDLTFLSANLLKIPAGGWLPLLIAAVLVLVFSTWHRGSSLLAAKRHEESVDLLPFITGLEAYPPQIVAGNAVYMTGAPTSVPKALLHNLKHNKVLHEQNILLCICTVDEPRIAPQQRIRAEVLSERFVRITADYGFQEVPSIQQILALCRKQGYPWEMMETSFFLSRDSLALADRSREDGMGWLRSRLFRWLYRNSTPATDFYRIPHNRVVEMGAQVKL